MSPVISNTTTTGRIRRNHPRIPIAANYSSTTIDSGDAPLQPLAAPGPGTRVVVPGTRVPGYPPSVRGSLRLSHWHGARRASGSCATVGMANP
eukprot:2302259-Rhodomonas_salina.1